MKIAHCAVTLYLGLVSYAIAEEPQAPSSQPSALLLTAPGTSSATENKPAATVAAESVNAAPTEAQIQVMRSRGYKPLTRNGTVVFCRSESEIGTHFEHTHCNTLDELTRAERSGKDYVNTIQQQGSPTPFKGP